MAEWVIAEVKETKKWTNTLFSLYIKAPIDNFIAGQFTKLAMEINHERIQRAYSFVNPPKNSTLEFYIVTVSNGKLSLHLQDLQFGDKLLITKKASGFFVLNEIPDCQTLWMLATGTAIGPYLSILQQGDHLDRFKNIVLIHGVRYFTDLSFLPLMKQLQQRYPNKLHIQAIVSRETIPGLLNGRITQLIENGELERAVGLSIDIKTSHVMLCGNPNMVHDTQNLLKKTRNMYNHLKSKSGHISKENYW